MQRRRTGAPICVMNIPEEVKNEARGLIEQYGDSFRYLGNCEGADFYMFNFPEDSSTGFPFVYQYFDGKVLTITGFAALDTVNSFLKDADESEVE